MSRPGFITAADIARWSKEIDEDKSLPPNLSKSPVIREVCFAGFWLSEQLSELNCPKSLIVRIQYTAGKISFGRDAWEIHQQFLDGYKNNKLDFATDPANMN